MTQQDLRIGIIGVGMMGADHAERVARRTSGARLVAVSDPDVARVTALATALDGVRVIDDPLQLIADAGVDAVIIASPGFAHAEQLMACLEHGKPVLCEKPLTMDTESSLRVVEAEQKAGRSLIQVGFMRRFDPEYAALKQLLDSGDLGRTLLLHNVHRNKTVPETFRSEMIVRDSLVHEVDVARWLFGDEIARITVHAPKPTSLVGDGVLDPQFAVFEMAGGAIADVEVFVNFQVGYEVRCEAVAEKGSATIGLGVDVLTKRAGHWGGAVPDDFRVRFGLAYDIEVQRWVNAAAKGEIDGPTAWDGYAAAAVCTAGVQSLQEGRPVEVEMVRRSEVLG
ncbi:Gfo/Idh/MocA family oxidoreductase [Kribbella qitaiheensis]|uniref:Inositol 2-dehydrogenase n=1 Tax=Kribbella qitaiheensis TaxID=1544730 RepID=A0A7G6X4B2_9ACTN|nr:Gfo/Idh/MocA family oxidoreductase [Kribbella qitaiheensis]QNE21077.1 Gfo/Idh/MocA family oxidoreductase [Kribbella qitaiheensis]